MNNFFKYVGMFIDEVDGKEMKDCDYSSLHC